jgi:hypothetical protein
VSSAEGGTVVKADIFCGQEHNIDVTQSAIRKIVLQSTTRRINIGSEIASFFSTTPNPFYVQLQARGGPPTHLFLVLIVCRIYEKKSEFAGPPGGTCMITRGNLAGRFQKQIPDKWGRWVCQEFR